MRILGLAMCVCALSAGVGCGRVLYEPARDVGASDAFLDRTRAAICGRPGAIACLDFETDPGPEWERFTDSTPVVYDTSQPFRGRALHLRSNATARTQGLRLAVPGAAFRTLYLTAWVRVERTMDVGYAAILEANNGDPSAFVKVSADQYPEGALGLTITGRSTLTRADFFATGRWHCLQLEVVEGAPGRGNYGAYSSGGGLGYAGPANPTALNHVLVELVTEGQTMEAWIDDVYVGPERGCLPAM